MGVIEFTPEQLELPVKALKRCAPAPSDFDPMEEARAVARHYGLPVKEVLGPARYGTLPAARRELYVRLLAHGWSYPQIGKFVGDRDRSTVLHGLGLHGPRCPVCDERGHGKRSCPRFTKESP